jgi:hypothetical protein
MDSPISLPATPILTTPAIPPHTPLSIRTPPDEHEHSDAEIHMEFPGDSDSEHSSFHPSFPTAPHSPTEVQFFFEHPEVRDSPHTYHDDDHHEDDHHEDDYHEDEILMERAKTLTTEIVKKSCEERGLVNVLTPYQLYFRDPLRYRLFPTTADRQWDYPAIGHAWKHIHRVSSHHYHREYLKRIFLSSTELVADMTERLDVFVGTMTPLPKKLELEHCSATSYPIEGGRKLYILEPRLPILGKHRFRLYQIESLAECDPAERYHCDFVSGTTILADISISRTHITNELVIIDNSTKTGWMIFILSKGAEPIQDCGLPDCERFVKSGSFLKLTSEDCPHYPFCIAPGKFTKFLP